MARASLHEKARGWMRTNCPGFFANDGSSHTLIDLMLTSDFDPVANRHIPREWSDALRAIGLTESGFQRYSSAEAPGLLLEPVHLSLTPAIGTDRSWAFWGSSSVAAAGAGPLDMYGSPQPWAIASHYSEGVESFLVTLSVSDLLGSLEERYSKIRDNAQAQHGRFRPRYLDQFRRQWLTLSLDVASTKRDLERDWASRPTFENEMEFTLDFDLPAVEGQESRTYEPVHVNDSMRRHQREMLDALVASDSEYRDILSTVASLGASAEASRTGRRALWVALVSLLVALATVLVSDVGDHSLLNAVRQFLSSLFNHS
jgi:hypothetical protein